MTLPTIKLQFVGHAPAKYAVENYHYSGIMPAGKTVKIGVWEDGGFIGVIIFGWGVQTNLVKRYGLKLTEGCELCRVALREHRTPVTRIISIAVKILKKANPGLKLIVSFADQNQGHLGVIYQAGNWIYTGESKSTPLYKVNGRWTHQRSGYYKSNVEEIKKILNKHRYLYPLDKETRDKVLPFKEPYPKSVDSLTGKIPGVLPGDGGSRPTSAHHSNKAEAGP